jgi:hypothetical protein
MTKANQQKGCTMISATDPAFWQQYPNGCTVYDRLGRELRHVESWNPETGEVIAFDTSRLTKFLLRLVQLNTPGAWRLRLLGSRITWREGMFGRTSGELLRRHGFWPAPLQVVPRLAVHIGFEADEDPIT